MYAEGVCEPLTGPDAFVGLREGGHRAILHRKAKVRNMLYIYIYQIKYVHKLCTVLMY